MAAPIPSMKWKRSTTAGCPESANYAVQRTAGSRCSPRGPLTATDRRTDVHVPEKPLMPAQQNRTAWKIALGLVGMLVLFLIFLIVIGSTTDLWLGFPLLRSARSWTTWLLGVLALAVLYLVGEGGSEWIKKRDRRSQ